MAKRWLAAIVTSIVLLASPPAPVRAGGPMIVGGGDDPSVSEVPTPADQALNDWKRGIARQHAAAVAGGPEFPCGPDCPPPSSYVLQNYARTQIKNFYCGPASSQVIINRTRGVYSSNRNGESTTTNYVKQSTIGAYIGTDTQGQTDAWMLKSGLNHYANTNVSDYGNVQFSVVSQIGTGYDFHWAVITATYDFQRGAGIPVQMTFSSQHLASWSNQTWWNSHQGTTVRHWLSARGYYGFWDGTYGPNVYYTDSSAGLGGSTGEFMDDSRLVYNLDEANSGRFVY